MLIYRLLLLGLFDSLVSAQHSDMWNNCKAKEWVPFRLGGRADVSESFYACMMEVRIYFFQLDAIL